jgi:hypothetical protein
VYSANLALLQNVAGLDHLILGHISGRCGAALLFACFVKDIFDAVNHRSKPARHAVFSELFGSCNFIGARLVCFYQLVAFRRNSGVICRHFLYRFLCEIHRRIDLPLLFLLRTVR